MLGFDITKRFTAPFPMFVSLGEDEVAVEIKPYLQPFERELALCELRELLGRECDLREEHGYWIARSDVPDDLLRARLTYWQRVGRESLQPTLQKALELTQNGAAAVQKCSKLHSARRLRYGPHNLHEYRGKFFPQLVRSLINVSGVHDGALVLDPMSGSGTTTCEAVALGMAGIGVDLNPLSALIASVKTSIPGLDAAEFSKIATTHLSEFVFQSTDPAQIWDDFDLAYLQRWFDPKAIRDLASAVIGIDLIQNPTYHGLFRVCLSNIVRSVSWQKASDLRVRKEVLPYESGAVQKRFVAESVCQIDRIHSYLSVLDLKGSSDFEIRMGDAVDVASVFPEHRGEVDLLITSPPYATALPYLDTDRLSLIILGLLPRKQHGDAERSMVGTREVTEGQRRNAWDIYLGRKDELPAKISTLIDWIASVNHGDGVGFRRRNLPALLGKYFLSMLDAMRSARRMMKPGALGYYVVGNNSTSVDGEKVEIPTDCFLVALGEAAGWAPVEQIPMELLVSRDIFRANRGSSETILSFRA